MPLTLADIRPGQWIVFDKEIVGRRRMIALDQRGRFVTISDTGYVMLTSMDKEEVLANYGAGWKAEK